MRVALVVTVQTTAPAGLFNPYGAVYALWKRMAEDAVSVILNIFFLTDASLGFTDCSCGPDYLGTGNNCRGRSFFTSLCVCVGGGGAGGGGVDTDLRH